MPCKIGVLGGKGRGGQGACAQMVVPLLSEDFLLHALAWSLCCLLTRNPNVGTLARGGKCRPGVRL